MKKLDAMQVAIIVEALEKARVELNPNSLGRSSAAAKIEVALKLLKD